MTNILVLKIALSSETETLLTQISDICTEQSIAFFVAGATAREVLLHHVHGRKIGRKTRDIDIAIFVDNWQQFEELKAVLIAQGATVFKGNAHHLLWQDNELDIIPFGNIAVENTLAWPPDRAIVMAVDGFLEAFQQAAPVRLSNGSVLLFCSLPGLALLKLFAWRDRGNQNGKDALDLFTIISEYSHIEEDRIYDIPLDIDNFDSDPDRLGAFLLGTDVTSLLQQTAENETFMQLLQLQTPRLVDAIVHQYSRDTPARVEQLIEDFWLGITTPLE
ncbi:nucleotidyl transferase AbiEii/AbiGii toxin family protein [Serratia proteamaculans]|uniref:nucleotidyl transferase AbiEii/AbiGii toxin family protein n=1 Tax=Serratia proteamaculans TaxID=28151 RepID=UPI0039AEE17A